MGVQVDCEQSLLFPPVIVLSAETERKRRPRGEWGGWGLPFSMRPTLPRSFLRSVLSLEGKGGTARSLVFRWLIGSASASHQCSLGSIPGWVSDPSAVIEKGLSSPV